MKSKISFFNFGIFKSMLRRFWPLWAAHFGIWLLILPIPSLISTLTDARHTDSIVYLVQATTGWMPVIFAFFAAIIIAMAMYSFLYNNRSTGLIASLPVSREAVFCSAYLAGLLTVTASNLIIALLTFLSALGSGVSAAVVFKLVLYWFGVYTLDFIIFYGIAVLTAMLTGNIIALPVLYGIFNFLVVGMEQIINIFLGEFVFGLPSYGASSTLEFLSPAVYLLSRQEVKVEMSNVIDPATQLHVIESVSFRSWLMLAAFAAAAVVLSAAALMLLRRRRMETAGDVIAIPCLRPVFKYGVTICAALCGGLLLYEIFFSLIDHRGVAVFVMIPCMIVSAFIGYFASEMLLKKSFHVLKGNWVGFIVVSCLCAAFTFCCDLDILNIAHRLPDADEVEYVTVDGCNIRDEKTIEELIKVNKAIVDNQDEYKFGAPICISYTYHLKDGKQINRDYYIDGDEVYRQYADVMNSETVLIGRYTPAVAVNEKNVYNAYVEYYLPNGNDVYDEMSPEQAVDFYRNALIPDIKNGNKKLYGNVDEEETPVYVSIDLLGYDPVTGDENGDSLWIQVSSECTECARWLKENLGIDVAEIEAAYASDGMTEDFAKMN